MTDNWQRSYHVVLGIAVDVGLAIGSDGSQFDRLDEDFFTVNQDSLQQN